MKLKKVIYTVIIISLFLINTTSILAVEQDSNIKLEKRGEGYTFTTDIPIKPTPKVKAQQIINLPSSFDLRDVGEKNYVTPVKSQYPWNNCWSFAALAAAESNALIDGASNPDLSERALTWFSYQNQSLKGSQEYEGINLTNPSGNKNLPFMVGGDPYTVVSQMSSWNGASTEAQAPYQNDEGFTTEEFGETVYSPNGTWSLPYNNIYDNAYHLQNAYTINTYRNYSTENISNYTLNVKEFIMGTGAVNVSFNMTTGTDYFNNKTYAQYAPESVGINHCVAIVGWDDNYPISNFSSAYPPPANGAWICKNSWGPSWGNDGYFYLSYYDQTILDFTTFDVELEQTGYSYDNNFEYDLLGNKMGLSRASDLSWLFNYNAEGGNSDNLKLANVFSAEDDQILKAYSAYTNISTPTQITTQVYILNENSQNPEDGELILSQVDQAELEGLHTFEFDEPIELEAGSKFSIVQNIVYLDLVLGEEQIGEVAGLSLEYGLASPLTLPFSNNDLLSIVTYTDTISVEPGQSYIYGINEQGQVNTNEWTDLSNQNIRQELSVDISSYFGSESEITALPGNPMIKVYSSNVDSSVIPAETISINNGLKETYLATSEAGPNATTSLELTATVTPAEANTPITWVSSSNSICSISSTSGSTITVNAVSEGKAIISAISDNASANLIITVTNNKTVCESVAIDSISPDYFTVIANNVQCNPALNLPNAEVEHVAMFCWSEKDQGDMNAKVAQRISGTNNWEWQRFPVNNNDNFFTNADNIIIHVYGSIDPNSNGNIMGIAYNSWVNTIEGNNLVTYTTYSQNLGFNHPAITDAFISGITNRNLHLEGIRVSSNILGVEVNSTVHVQNLGWLETQPDGTYNGTMHRDLGIEAIKLSLTGHNASNYQITYRVMPEGGNWSNWVIGGTEVGSIGRNIQLRAIEVKINPLFTPYY